MANWREVLEEIQRDTVEHQQKASQSVDIVRRRYLQQLHDHTQRNVIAYYSGWLAKPNIQGTEITDEDKNAFMMAVHHVDRTKGVDLILHTPGGSVAAAESLVDYLVRMFGTNIRVIIPQLAMSAGTMIACASTAVVMGKHSSLGPIDPHLRGIPAQTVLDEFERAYVEISKDNSRAFVWRPILEKYHPTFLVQCENAVKWSKEFVQRNLATIMFAGEADAAVKAADIVGKMLTFGADNAHDRHLNVDACAAIGLKIQRLEEDQALQELVLTVHHCYMHALSNTACYKIIENHLGVAMAKQQQPQGPVFQLPQAIQAVADRPAQEVADD